MLSQRRLQELCPHLLPPRSPMRNASAIEHRISTLEENKEVFIAAQNFEDAARCRSEQIGLKTLLAWYDWFRKYP